MCDYTDDDLVEQPAIALFEELDCVAMDCFNETCGPQRLLRVDPPGREGADL